MATRYDDSLDNCYPPDIDLHADVRARLEEVTKDWDGDYIPTDVDIVYPLSKPPFISIHMFCTTDHFTYFADIECTRLERILWGLEPDPYTGKDS